MKKMGVVFGIFVFLILCAGIEAQTKTIANSTSKIEPKALEILNKMALAYRDIPALTLTTEFSSEQLAEESANPTVKNNSKIEKKASDADSTEGAEKDNPKKNQLEKSNRAVRLFYQRPNRLRVEVEEISTRTNQKITTQWVCDGKTFWNFLPEKNGYTREKAPRSLKDFAKLETFAPVCLELLLLQGDNPFEEVVKNADSLQYLGTEQIRDVSVDVLQLKMTARFDKVEMRLYIGKEDSLIYRLVHDYMPAEISVEPGRIGDDLDELLDISQPVTDVDPRFAQDAKTNPMPPKDMESDDDPVSAKTSATGKSRTITDNFIKTIDYFSPTTFLFTIPSSASLYSKTELNTKASKRSTKDLLKLLRQRATALRKEK